MKIILERLRSYLRALKMRHRDGARRAALLPLSPEQSPDLPSAYDPYAEMRKVLATSMLLG